MTDAFVIFCTCGSSQEAQALATALVEEHLAACVNIIPEIRSVYRWQGRVETAGELLLIIKSAGDRLAAIQSRLQALHSYETPEVIALPIVSGSEDYLAWIRDQTRESEPG